MNEFTERIKELRLEKGLLQKDIADILKITQQQYSLYENGTRTIGIELINKLAKYYDVNVEYLLGITNIRTHYPKN